MRTFFNIIFISISVIMLQACGNSPSEETVKETDENTIKKPQDQSPALYINPNIEKSLVSQGLVDIQVIDSTIMVNLKYSTNDNFFKKDVYGKLQRAYMQEVPAEALSKANSYLQGQNPKLRLLVYDAARPHHIQHILWKTLDSIPPKKRKDFVADPAEGSIHNYGCAVDLTVFDIDQNQPLDMGTAYDYFGYEAYPRKETEMLISGKLTAAHLENRMILRNAMLKAGFMPISSEWWHFNYYSRVRAQKIYKIIQ